MADLITKVRSEMADRIKELEPVVREHAELTRAAEALGQPKLVEPTKRGRPPGRPPKEAKRRVGRKVGSGRRRAEVLDLLSKNDTGLTIPELADQMKMKSPHYLYRILPSLVNEGLIAKDDEKYKTLA